MTKVSGLFSEDKVKSEVLERDETALKHPLLENCEEIEEEESGQKGHNENDRADIYCSCWIAIYIYFRDNTNFNQLLFYLYANYAS